LKYSDSLYNEMTNRIRDAGKLIHMEWGLIKYKLLRPVGLLQLYLFYSERLDGAWAAASSPRSATYIKHIGPIRLRHACQVTVAAQRSQPATRLV